MASKTIPGPSDTELLNSLFAAQRDPLGFLMDLMLKYGDIVRVRIGPQVSYILNHPDYIRDVLVNKDKKYQKVTQEREALSALVGEGLLSSEGDLWKQHRRIMQPLFSGQHFDHYAGIITNLTADYLEHWKPHAASGASVEFNAEMSRLTLSVVAKCLLDIDIGKASQELLSAIVIGLDHVNESVETILPIPVWIPTPSNLRFQRAKGLLDKIVGDMIRERRKPGAAGEGLLSILVKASDEQTGKGMSDQHVRDQVMTIFLAGHETTAQTLTWTIYLLSKHPDVMRRLRAEVHEVLGERTPTLKDLPKLEYTHQVIQEAMRLFPPVWMLEREAVKDDAFDGYPIPAGSVVTMSQYVMHRHPKYWENPEGFDPDRFSPERSAGLSHGIYFPFGAGPRVCIGNTFAMMEAQLVLPMIVRRYRIDLVPGQALALKPSITLRPRYGLHVTLHDQK